MPKQVQHAGLSAPRSPGLGEAHQWRILTASIAHEVNQPLSGIMTNAGTCLRMLNANPPDIEGARETAQRTIRDVKRAADVIERLRALFAEREPDTELVDLNETVHEALRMSRAELERARVTARCQLADGMPLLLGDQIQLQQIVLNLVRNAVDAMRGIVGRACELMVMTAWQPGAEWMRLGVQDVGTGVVADDLDKLFEPFFSTKPHGMGIGLSISRSIAERHGGRLWAEPNIGPGATFWLAIPATRLAPVRAQSPRRVSAGRYQVAPTS